MRCAYLVVDRSQSTRSALISADDIRAHSMSVAVVSQPFDRATAGGALVVDDDVTVRRCVGVVAAFVFGGEVDVDDVWVEPGEVSGPFGEGGDGVRRFPDSLQGGIESALVLTCSTNAAQQVRFRFEVQVYGAARDLGLGGDGGHGDRVEAVAVDGARRALGDLDSVALPDMTALTTRTASRT